MERLQYIDNAKAIGIVLMIIGHCSLLSTIPYAGRVIYSFHMTLFFILTGFFIKPMSNFYDLTKKASKTFIRPYLLTCVAMFILLCFCLIIKEKISLEYFIDYLIRVLFASGSEKGTELWANTPIVGPIWFLWAMFWGYTIFSFIIKSASDRKALIVSIVLFLISCMSIKYYRLPLSIQAGLNSIFYLCIGYLIKKYSILDKIKSPGIFLCLLFVWGIGIWRGGVSISHCYYPLGIVSAVASIAGSIIVLKLCQLTRFNASFVGQHTLLILCIHQLAIYYRLIFGDLFIGVHNELPMLLLYEIVANIVFAIGLTYFIVRLKNIIIIK